jgi:hypothetical protein
VATKEGVDRSFQGIKTTGSCSKSITDQPEPFFLYYTITVLFVFVEPFIAVFSEELVSAKGSVDKPIYKGGCKILACRVDLAGAKRRPSVQVRLVDVLRGLGLNDVKLGKMNQSIRFNLPADNQHIVPIS